MVLYDMQEFGGLEEYATTLAIGLQQRGHQVSILSTAWVPTANQYLQRLRANGIALVQLPKWISHPASDWQTKEKILDVFTWLFSPLILLLGSLLILVRRRSGIDSLRSARNWFRAQVMKRFIGPDWRKPFVRLMLEYWKIVWRPEIFHIQGYTTSLLFVIEWAHDRNIPVVYEEHQTPDPQFNWWKGFEHSINLANRVIAVSEKSAQGLRDVCGVTRPIVVRGPLLPDPFASGWKKDSKQQNDKPFTITTVARLYITKGLTYLLEAAALVKRTYPNVEFKVYGEGELRDELLAKAKSLGFEGEKIFVGAFTDREELSRIMAGTDIFLMSSILEGQPLSVVEAMAYGCPIVTTAVGGIPELIQDGVNGLLCPPEDPQCLADNIRLLIDDPSLRQRLGNAARASYEKSPFQPAAVCQEFASIYNKVLQGR